VSGQIFRHIWFSLLLKLARGRCFLAYALAALGYNGLVFYEAKLAARAVEKPLLNVGCKSIYTDASDVNLDIVPRAVPRFTLGDIQDLSMFQSKRFGAAYASHVLEHVENPDAALRELQRVADNVFVITPLPIWPWAWLHPDHKWIMWGTTKLWRLPQNGMSPGRK
jgi:hypothetical protein